MGIGPLPSLENAMATLPDHYRNVRKQHPDYMKAVEALGKATHKAGPLDDKTAHLVQLAAGVSLRSEGAVHSHTRRALDAGATPEEVRHAVILLTSTVGFPTVNAALSWVEDILESQ